MKKGKNEKLTSFTEESLEFEFEKGSLQRNLWFGLLQRALARPIQSTFSTMAMAGGNHHHHRPPPPPPIISITLRMVVENR